MKRYVVYADRVGTWPYDDVVAAKARMTETAKKYPKIECGLFELVMQTEVLFEIKLQPITFPLGEPEIVVKPPVVVEDEDDDLLLDDEENKEERL